MTRLISDIDKIVEAARIRQLVDRTDFRVAFENEMANQRGADEAGATRN